MPRYAIVSYLLCLFFSDPKSSVLMNQPPSPHVVKTVGYLSVSGSQGKNFFDLVMRNVESRIFGLIFSTEQ